MKNLRFDSVLLFALVVPFIMTYRIGPGDTPYWLFGLIFSGIFVYILLDIVSLREKTYALCKLITLWTLITLTIGSAFVSAIIVRHQTSPLYMIHDITLQQELALRFLLDGKNPYAVTYFNTPLEQWHYSDTEVNPALYHFVMMPFYLVFALPFYIVSIPVLGYFDGRMPLLFLLFFLLFLSSFLTKNHEKKRLALVLFAFHPAMLPYTLEGRSDMFMFVFLFAALFLLHKKKSKLSGISMGLAFAIKQSVWPIFPFYFAYLLFQHEKIKEALKALMPFLLTFLACTLPFLLWSPKEFIDSTVFYLSGNTPNSYPIAGYGFGMMLHQFGFIRNLHQYYPFYIWQLVLCVPAFIILLFYLKRSPSVARLVVCYGIFLFLFWYFSRYFNNNHVVYISLLFITAYFWPRNTKHEKTW